MSRPESARAKQTAMEATISVRADAIPESLKARDTWLVWRYEEHDGRIRKMPYDPKTGRAASVTDPSTWGTFEQAIAASPTFSGVGIVLGDGLVGVDLDDVRDPGTGRIEQWAEEVITAMASYAEVSPSGTGVHILLNAAALPAGRRRKDSVEIYGEGSPRYFSATGCHVEGTPLTIEERTAELAELHARYLAEPPRSNRSCGRAQDTTAAATGLTDDEILATARKARNGDEFQRLWAGGYPDDDSVGDLKLCGMLAFYAGPDGATIDRLFRQSGRYRKKWERADYRERTIEKALEGRTEFYRPHSAQLAAAQRGGPRVSEPSPGPSVKALVTRVKRSRDPSAVWSAVPQLARLGRAEYAAAKQELKAALGGLLNLNDLDGAVREARKRPSLAEAGDLEDRLPVVVAGRQLRDVSRDSLKALTEANDPPVLFVRSGGLARLQRDEEGRLVIAAVGVDELRNRLKNVATFVRPGDQGDRDVDPPETVVCDLLAEPEFPFPSLAGVVEIPVLRPDGSVLITPGYDPATRLYYAPSDGLSIPCIPDVPSSRDLERAVAIVLEAIGDFPFVDDASRANAMALLLTPVVRPAIGGNVPLALIDAPQAGTGKSLLSEVVATIATGRSAAMLTAPRDDEEWRKRITAVLQTGATIVTVDNLEQALEAPSLAAVLTARRGSDRLLGRNDVTLDLPARQVWIATGNNIALRGDLARRCYWIRLDAQTARPWQRAEFTHPDILGWVRDNRGQLVAGLLTMARAWYAAESPPAEVPRLGSFGEWAAVVGGILDFANIPAFLGNLPSLWEQADEETQQWEGFLTAWAAHFGGRLATVAEILDAAGDASSELHGALPDACLGRTGEPDRRRTGHALKKKLGVRLGDADHHLESPRAQGKVRLWQVLSGRSTG
jgi:hypothetical protein